MRRPYAHLACPKCGKPHYDLFEPIRTPRKGIGKKVAVEEFSSPHLTHQCGCCGEWFASSFPAIGIPKVSFIMAVAEDKASPGKFIIGSEGGLPWVHSPGDMAHFRRKTIGKSVIVGNKTFTASSAFPLIDRQHWVLTKTPTSPKHRVAYVTNPNRVFSSTPISGELIVIGGGQVYPLYSDMYSEAWVTYIDSTVTGDTYVDLPLLLRNSGLVLVPSDTVESIASTPAYRICHYVRKEATP